jgi:ABC-type uncharacterized transport system involved in gliding motility auxiliary subunit
MSSAISYSLIAGVALLVCYGVLSPTAVAELVRRRQTRFGSLSVVVSAAAIGILVMANVVASRSVASADLTRAGLFTLSPKSVLVTKRLDSDLSVVGFFRPGTDDAARRAAVALLAEYQKQSGHVKVSVVNPDTNQQLVVKTGVTINGSISFTYKDRTPIVLNLASQTESDITSAILKLESATTPTVCWGSGEGERDLKSTQVDGYSSANDALTQDNFKVQEIVLSQTPVVPATCDIVAVVGLQRPLTDPAVAALQTYLQQGGRLLMAVDPWTYDQKTNQDPIRQSANNLLAPYGAQFDGGLVIDPDPAHSASNDPTTPAIFAYGDSPISKDLANKLSFFPQPTTISGQPPTAVTDVALTQTTSSSYTLPTATDKIDKPAAAKTGPFTLMATREQLLSGTDAQGQAKKTRIVLVGTSSIAENRTMPPNAPGYNSQLFQASFDWLAGNDQLIAISPKPAAKYPLPLTAQDLAVNVAITSFLVPALMIGAGIAVWLVRRRSYSTT